MNKSNFDKFVQDLDSVQSLSGKFQKEPAYSYEQNISQYERKIYGVFVPSSRADISTVVQLANKHKVPLYPISKGYNWAFGSRLPVYENSVVVDLRLLSSISEYDAEMGTVRIEPGVSQGQLGSFLIENKSRYFLDVTGSGFHTSIIGNALERGIAYNSLRSDYILDLEVMLGSGEIIRTGFGTFPDPTPRNIYRYGLGPSVDQLFFQSNYGIVLAATYQLHPVPESKMALQIKFKTTDLSYVIDAFRDLKQQGVLDCIIHAADPVRSATTLCPLLSKEAGENLWKSIKDDQWSSIASVHGSAGIIHEKLKIVKTRLGSAAQVISFNEKKISLAKKLLSFFGATTKLDFLNSTTGLRGLVHGQATNDALFAAFYRGDTEEYKGFLEKAGIASKQADFSIDSSPLGLLFCVPLADFRGRSAVKIYEVVQESSKKTKILMGVTLNGISEKCLEAVISLHFDPSQKESAHKCLVEMYKVFAAQGIYPYRLNPDTMNFLDTRKRNEIEFYRSIKHMMDPNNILSPGRYESTCERDPVNQE